MRKIIMCSFAGLFLGLFSIATAQTQWVADITVEYDAALLADTYEVIVRDSGGESVFSVGSSLSPTVHGVLAGALYTVSVRAVNQWGTGDEFVLGQADLRKPGRPSDGRIVSISGRKQ